MKNDKYKNCKDPKFAKIMDELVKMRLDDIKEFWKKFNKVPKS